ncbi:DUF4097 family beta strand repeat-containing protein [Spongiivirga sp. MCCC 1A20706]|uniref:DUF4097 family beta strand repeat-containing protein n=1 Tax=Spongiivirga sp. MCCC 1A20706 TaxID=3160963 RepID=UPI0039777899
MKKQTLLVLFTIVAFSINAQDFKQSLQGITKVKLMSTNDIIVKSHDKNEILIESNGHKRPEKAKGLKAIYAGGTDNTGLGINVEKNGDVLEVTNLKNMHGPKMVVYISESVAVHAECKTVGDLNISGFKSEIEVKATAGTIKILDVTGPVIAKASAGDITVEFSKVNQSSPISIYSSAGDVDIKLPANTAANLDLRSTMGEIYTDFDLKFSNEKKDMKILSGRRHLKTEINNGGVGITLRSSVGDIYLRKSK